MLFLIYQHILIYYFEQSYHKAKIKPNIKTDNNKEAAKRCGRLDYWLANIHSSTPGIHDNNIHGHLIFFGQWNVGRRGSVPTLSLGFKMHHLLLDEVMPTVHSYWIPGGETRNRPELTPCVNQSCPH